MERPVNPIHLDGLIANRLVRRDLPADTHLDLIKTRILELPLARMEVGGDWVWAASTIAFEWTAPPSQAFATLAIRAHEIAPIQASGIMTNRAPDTKIDTARGQYKAGTYARDRQWAARAMAFCIGDEEQIRDLMTGLDQIGPRRRLGAGVVTGVEVVQDERALDLWRRRSLPVGADGPGRLAEGAYRLPPYDPANRTVVRTYPLEYAETIAASKAA